jgi:RNA polymerase sigma factor (sigma-70 family)
MESQTLKMPESTIQTGGASEESPTLSELFVAMEGPLLAYATKLMHSRNDAQDIVQESFVRLHGHFDEVRQPKAWLYRTVRNLAFNHKRKHGRVIHFDPSGQDEGYSREPADEDVLPDERIERMEAVGMLMICMDRLEEDVKELVRMKFVEELSYKEMAVRTGLNVGNVGYKLHHAIKFLANEMESEGLPI